MRLFSIRPNAALVAMMAAVTGVPAQTAEGNTSAPVYRCPGPPVLYTDALSASEAREKNCRTLEGATVTVIQGQRPRPAATPVPPASAARPANDAGSKVEPSQQRARDSDARRILEDELRKEEAQLAALQKEYNNGEPERRGDERNFQKYQDRVAELKAAVGRKESDIAAIKRELTKLPQ